MARGKSATALPLTVHRGFRPGSSLPPNSRKSYLAERDFPPLLIAALPSHIYPFSESPLAPSVTEKLVWHGVTVFAADIGISKLAPHHLRRSSVRLCRAAGGELEQIQFLLGHLSVKTTERYLGWTQRISSAVSDPHRHRADALNSTSPKGWRPPARNRLAHQRVACSYCRAHAFSGNSRLSS